MFDIIIGKLGNMRINFTKLQNIKTIKKTQYESLHRPIIRNHSHFFFIIHKRKFDKKH